MIWEHAVIEDREDRLLAAFELLFAGFEIGELEKDSHLTIIGPGLS